MIHFHQALIIGEKNDLFSPNILEYLQELSKQLIESISFLFPTLLSIAIVTVNLSLISGTLVYLLDYSQSPRAQTSGLFR
ncbi:MAG: hypothetical protein ACFFB5_17440 [Promethearchaeota archaeon]